jgi:hypothetical protein
MYEIILSKDAQDLHEMYETEITNNNIATQHEIVSTCTSYWEKEVTGEGLFF